MKRFLFSFVFLLSVLSMQIIAQDIMDVPPGADLKNLVPTIEGDTLATGARANPNRIYRLERDAVYIMSSTLKANYSVRLIAADGVGRPPMLIPGKDAEGKDIATLINLIGSATESYFTNIIFNGVTLDRVQPVWSQAVVVAADDVSINFQGCVFNAFGGGTNTMYGSNHLRAYFRDCVWRNGVSDIHPFIGQQVQLPALQIDTLIVTNCTYFNNTSFWLFQENHTATYAVIEHNTIFTSAIDDFRMRFLGKGNVRSNLWYGALAYGNTDKSMKAGWFFPNAFPGAIIQFTDIPDSILSDVGMTRAERIINLTNNAYFWPQQIKDYWDSYEYVFPSIWMNDSTKSIFTDKATWPGLVDENNVEIDPKFTDVDMDTWILGEVATWCREHRDSSPDTTWGTAASKRNYDEHKGVDILNGISWPLPEDLAYSDATLLTAGHDGLPVGDLNWFPAQKANYVEDEIAGGNTLAPIENKQITAQTGQFTATWKVTPTHSPMDGVTGLAKGEVGAFGDMGVLVRMNSSGKVDARNGGGYEALNELAYEANKEYTIEVAVDVPAQKYSVTVTPAGGDPVVIGTDYAFRTDTPQESLGYLAMVINELQQWGGVPGSRLNPSFLNDDYTIVTGVEKTDSDLPTEFAIEQNYPNPFNPTTVINYSVAKVTNVNIEVFNSLGQKVKTLVNGKQSVGNYSVDWNGTDVNNKKVASGIYFYKINAGQFIETRKMLLMK